jgi:hypothetical protein
MGGGLRAGGRIDGRRPSGLPRLYKSSAILDEIWTKHPSASALVRRAGNVARTTDRAGEASETVHHLATSGHR